MFSQWAASASSSGYWSPGESFASIRYQRFSSATKEKSMEKISFASGSIDFDTSDAISRSSLGTSCRLGQNSPPHAETLHRNSSAFFGYRTLAIEIFPPAWSRRKSCTPSTIPGIHLEKSLNSWSTCTIQSGSRVSFVFGSESSSLVIFRMPFPPYHSVGLRMSVWPLKRFRTFSYSKYSDTSAVAGWYFLNAR